MKERVKNLRLPRSTIYSETMDISLGFLPSSKVIRRAKTEDKIEIVAYQQLATPFKIDCRTYLPVAHHPLFTWYSQFNEDMADNSDGKVYVEHKEGLLMLVFLTPTYKHSGFYFCKGLHVNTLFQLKLVLVVFGLAELSMRSLLPIRVQSCDDVATEDVFVTVKNSFCSAKQSKDPFSCFYTVVGECRRYEEGMSVLRNTIIRKTNPATDYRALGDVVMCDTFCKINRMSQRLEASLEETEEKFRSLTDQFSDVVVADEMVLAKEKSFICPPGFFLLTNFSCAPCLPGTYTHVWGDFSTCLPCPKGSYMPYAGHYYCLQCHNSSTTETTGSIDRSSCLHPQQTSESFPEWRVLEEKEDDVDELTRVLFACVFVVVLFVGLGLSCFFFSETFVPMFCRKKFEKCVERFFH